MPKGIVIECPICGSQRSFNIDIGEFDTESIPELLKQRLRMSGKEHLKQVHGQDGMEEYQWYKMLESMFEADLPQPIVDEIDSDGQGPIWKDYNLQPI